MSLVLGPRGGGKSFLSALGTHFDSRFYRRHGTKVLGGSLAQSQQIYDALKTVILDGTGPLGSDRDRVKELLKTEARYHNGSDVSILGASEKSVRGPHIPSLRLDEIDEMESGLRESALGMCMDRGEASAMVAMTSTWHRVGGPMAELIEKANGGDFPVFSFCIFEVLERCPEERSGPNLENCPECPLMPWCHSDVEDIEQSGGLPKAKRSDGHYSVGALIQKVRAVSRRVFEADYLCSGPKADGLWFPAFDPASKAYVTEAAEYDPVKPVCLGVDSGVVTGASWFQVDESSGVPIVTIFADYLREGLTAESNARAILEISQSRCNGKVDYGWTDPAGGYRNPVGATVLQEYSKVGLHLRPWPVVSVGESLNVIEGMVNPASGPPRILIHPRCVHTIRAFQSYRRAKRKGQWMDYPEDPQHPAEDMIDALRGAVYAMVGRRREVTIYQ